MIVFDATMLLLAVNPRAGVPIDPITGRCVDHVEQRIQAVLCDADRAKSKIGIPTPALSEALVRSRLHPSEIVAVIQSLSVFRILPFDELAAIELALIHRAALSLGDKKSGSTDTWTKVKFDRQIVAIAKVADAEAVYTDDIGLTKACEARGLKAISLAAVMLPESVAQIDFFIPDGNAGDLEADAVRLRDDQDDMDS